MGRTRTTAAVLGTVAAVVLGLLGPVAPAGAAPLPPDRAAAGPPAQVTLITGDRVLVRPAAGSRCGRRPAGSG